MHSTSVLTYQWLRNHVYHAVTNDKNVTMAFERVQSMAPSMHCYISSLNITSECQAPYVKQIASCLLGVSASVPISRDRWNTPAILKFSYDYLSLEAVASAEHDGIIKWKRFPRYWPFVRGIHRSPVNSPHKGQWRGSLMFSLICLWTKGWVNNREAGDLRRYRAHYDVIVMKQEL